MGMAFFCHLVTVHRPTNRLQAGIGKQFDSVQDSVSEQDGFKFGE